MKSSHLCNSGSKNNVKYENNTTQACRNEKKSEGGGGGLEAYQKKLVKLVSWLRRSFSWNRLKCPELLNKVEVGNANSQHK